MLISSSSFRTRTSDHLSNLFVHFTIKLCMMLATQPFCFMMSKMPQCTPAVSSLYLSASPEQRHLGQHLVWSVACFWLRSTVHVLSSLWPRYKQCIHSCISNLRCTTCSHTSLNMSCLCMCSIIIAVGYMFRYSAMAQAAKKILKEHNATPLAVIARYACAYSDIRKKDWYAHPVNRPQTCLIHF